MCVSLSISIYLSLSLARLSPPLALPHHLTTENTILNTEYSILNTEYTLLNTEYTNLHKGCERGRRCRRSTRIAESARSLSLQTTKYTTLHTEYTILTTEFTILNTEYKNLHKGCESGRCCRRSTRIAGSAR